MLVKRLSFLPFILVLLLAACTADQHDPDIVTAPPTIESLAQAEDPATATALPTVTPPASSTPLPTAEPVDEPVPGAEPAAPTPQPTPTTEPDLVQVISGQTAEGVYFLGDLDAPITIIDYSDFL